jgi:hypothetical protein
MMSCTWILVVFYFLLTKYLPLLTLQVAPNSQRDRQAITMANHIFTINKYAMSTVPHNTDNSEYIVFGFFHVLKDLWNMICIMNVEHAIRIHLLSRIQFLEYTHLYISDFDYKIICITWVISLQVRQNCPLSYKIEWK